MKIEILNTKDFYAGLIFIFFGVLFVLVARSYPMGSAMRMGPSYFPTLLGGLLILLGLFVVVRAFSVSGEPIREWAIRPLMMVVASVVAFALVVQPLGLVLAILALVVISCLGGSVFRFREVALLFLALVVLSVAIFVVGLKLPFRVWPW